MTWSVKAISVAQVPSVWHIAAKMLGPAVARSGGRYDLKAVFRQVIEERAVLWLVTDDKKDVYCAFTTREAHYPRAKYLCVDFMGGEGLSEWAADVCALLDRYAADSGLDGVEMYGREGWVRILQPFGWRRNGVMLVKEGST